VRSENIHRTIKDKHHWSNWSHQHSNTKLVKHQLPVQFTFAHNMLEKILRLLLHYKNITVHKQHNT